MDVKKKIASFQQLGEKIKSLGNDEVHVLANQAQLKNRWFTYKSVKKALEGIAYMLKKDNLSQWIPNGLPHSRVPKTVGIVTAGNIPLVGFHDLLCVLVCDHFAVIKPSSGDEVLIHSVINWIIEIEPKFQKNIEIRDKIVGIDAVIATGSDNTSRYFEYSFRGIPSIIRKNRVSIAILKGDESEEDLKHLGEDVFSYFGLGCRNVSKIFTPKGYDLKKNFQCFESHQDVMNHDKYRNNYRYHKSINLVNKTPHLDLGFLLVISTDHLVSPISVLYHQTYDTLENLQQILKPMEEKIQCIVGKDYTSFGKAQRPELWDYADNIDVLKFLTALIRI